jgi:hypothetical protein
LLINSCNIVYINTDAVAVSLNEINIVYLINLFTIINILSNLTFHAEFFDDNNFIMKFIIIDFHDLFNTSIHVTSLYYLFLKSYSSAWITLSNVFYDLISKITDIVFSSYKILNFLNFKMFTDSVIVTFSY